MRNFCLFANEFGFGGFIILYKFGCGGLLESCILQAVVVPGKGRLSGATTGACHPELHNVNFFTRSKIFKPNFTPRKMRNL